MDQEAVEEVLADPIARELLESATPVRLAYIGPDGYPRVVPVGGWFDGERITVCTAVNMPKVRAIEANPHVALTIDTQTAPWRALLIRGRASVDVVDGVAEEYLNASRQGTDPEAWPAFEASVRKLYDQMARIKITPLWAKVLDFETRMPEALEELIARRGAE